MLQQPFRTMRAAVGYQATPFVPRRPRAAAAARVVVASAAPNKIYVCANTYCIKRGGARTQRLLTELCPEGVAVVKHECLDECPLGPNCGIDEAPDADGYVYTKVINKVETKEDVVALLRSLGLEPRA